MGHSSPSSTNVRFGPRLAITAWTPTPTASSRPTEARCQGVVNAHEDEAVVDDLHEQHAKDRADDAAASAEDRRAAEHDGGDHIEFGADEILRVRAAPENYVDEAADRGDRPGEHVERHLEPHDREPRAPSALGVSADGVQSATEHRLLSSSQTPTTSRATGTMRSGRLARAT
ncbi:hypothetical protein EVAR_73757_1 [Eumeta japonica]|uniref:Uncharacterized protein n=1 Tax=Eumeta variegata TaxID=151549 RepID=A0A4C1SSX7_EUMVA|nr:hypothetical protein EVAR_73757_1 [Eumeta japonica]